MRSCQSAAVCHCGCVRARMSYPPCVLMREEVPSSWQSAFVVLESAGSESCQHPDRLCPHIYLVPKHYRLLNRSVVYVNSYVWIKVFVLPLVLRLWWLYGAFLGGQYGALLEDCGGGRSCEGRGLESQSFRMSGRCQLVRPASFFSYDLHLNVYLMFICMFCNLHYVVYYLTAD